MQIVVVDDHSLDGDVAGLVYRLGRGRIRYFQHPANRGSLRNFETCLNRAQGEWVHLLHGDDLVVPGFYREIERLFNDCPSAGAAFTSHIFMNETGRDLSEYKPLMTQCGVLPALLVRLAGRHEAQAAAVVVKRSVGDRLGG